MTRITLSELKNAARDRTSRRAIGTRVAIPTPMPVAMSAVRRFHSVGAEAARDYLTRSFAGSAYWGAGGRQQARAWAEAIVSSFDTYIRLASEDNRAAFREGVAADVEVGRHSVGIAVDVILLDPGGYVARHVLWDVPELTQDNAELLSAPICSALQGELGEDRVVGAEVWHLRSATRWFVDANTAVARLPEVATIVQDYLS
jgi:hypothetical protein